VADCLIERTDIGTADFTLELVAAWRDRMLAGMGQSLTTEVQAFRIGEAAVVGLPGEIFVELGMAIKAGSPIQPTFVAELVGDSVGYLPTRKAYDEGGYEVTATIFAPGAGEMLVDVAVELMRGWG
jgi:neutral ceramidase